MIKSALFFFKENICFIHLNDNNIIHLKTILKNSLQEQIAICKIQRYYNVYIITLWHSYYFPLRMSCLTLQTKQLFWKTSKQCLQYRDSHFLHFLKDTFPLASSSQLMHVAFLGKQKSRQGLQKIPNWLYSKSPRIDTRLSTSWLRRCRRCLTHVKSVLRRW
jgi:hypothetical protein